MKEDFEFMTKITADLEARKAACKVLGVSEDSDKNELKRAYRKASIKYHPDHNQDDPDANKKFTLIKCAYELLAEDEACPQLLEEITSWSGVPEDGKYNLDNSWGHFLWWRDKFFGSGKQRNTNGERSSCI